jgi:endo-1,4-beta-xylanase
MVVLSFLLAACAALASTAASPTANSTVGTLGTRTSSAFTSSSTGTDHGFFYSFWTDGASGAQVSYSNGNAGEYSIQWSGNGNFVGGKGWKPGSAQCVARRPRWFVTADAHRPE